jgi:hypothetical protein
MVAGRPRYVTALGETDTPAGWRANKAHGGVLLDVDSGEPPQQLLRFFQIPLILQEAGQGGHASQHLLVIPAALTCMALVS